MQRTGKREKKQLDDNIRIDEFNRFCLEQSYKGETYFKMEGTQIVQNYKCELSYQTILERWRNKK